MKSIFNYLALVVVFIVIGTKTELKSIPPIQENSIAYTSFTVHGPVYPDTYFTADATFTNNGSKPFDSNHYAMVRDGSFNAKSSISANGVGLGASRSGTFTWQAPGIPQTYTYYYCGLEAGFGWFNSTTSFTVKVANPVKAWVRSDTSVLNLGQSTVVHGLYSLDTGVDFLVQNRIDMTDPSGAQTIVAGYGPGNIDYTFSPSAAGTYIFKTYVRTTIESNWTWWQTVTPSTATIIVNKGSTNVTISPTARTITAGQSITFTASGAQTGYVWGGTSGATGTGATKTVTFPTTGSFTVTVKDPGNSDWNASADATANITVTTGATPATFSVTPTTFTYNGAAQGPTITPSPAATTYTTTGTASATNAGSYSVTATANGNYTGSSGAVAWTIAKANQGVVSITSSSTSTLGNSYTATASGGNGSGAIVWALGTGSTAAGAAINASTGVVSASSIGTVVFKCYRAADSNYNQSATTANFTLTISSQPTVSFTVSPTTFTYTGAAQGPTITPSPAGATYSTSGTATATNAGSYSVTATANGSYTGSSGAVAWTIGKGTQSVLISPTAPSVTVGGSITFNASGGQNSYIWAGSAGAAGAGATTTVSFTTIGTFTVTVQDPGGANWNASNVATATITVLPVTATFSISPLSFVYSGSTQGPTITPSPAGATYSISGTATATNVGSYSVTATANGIYSGTSGAVAWTIAKANQGAVSITSNTTSTLGNSYTATASGGSGSGAIVWALGPGSTAAGAAINASTGVVTALSVGTVVFNCYRAADGNYNQSATTANFTLTVIPIATWYTVSPTTFTYNGAAQGPTITPSPAATTYLTSGTATATNVGSYSVTATANGNYTGTSGAVAWTITKANQGAVSITSSSTSTVGNSYTATASGGNGSGAIVWALGTGSTAAGAAINASTGVVSASSVGTVVFKCYRAADSNYNQSATTANFTLTVIPIATSFTFSPTTFTYNGAAQGPTITPSPAGATFTTSGTTSAINVGNFSVTANATGLYSGSSSVSWSIVQAIPTVILAPSDQTVVQGTSLTFTPSGGQNNYSWSGTAGASGIGATRTITFSSLGAFTVSAQSSAGGNYAASNVATSTITVVPPALLSVYGVTDFGTIRVNTGSPLTSTQTFTLSNTGGISMSVTGASTNGDFSITSINAGGVTYPVTIGAGSSVTLTITFNATAPGTRPGTLSIINTSTNNPTFNLVLTGLGVEGILVPSWSAIRNL